MILSCLSIIYLIVFNIHSTSSNCITVASSSSGSAQDAEASVSCSNPYTLVSCGYKAVNTGERVKGAYVTGQTCYARNSAGSSGIIAYARCCDFSANTPSTLTCSTLQSSGSGAGDGAKSAITCPATQSMLGCTSLSHSCAASWYCLDGNYPHTVGETIVSAQTMTSADTCSGENGSGGNGVYAYNTCCEFDDPGVTFSCFNVFSGQVDVATTTTVTVQCPSDGNNYFMVGCTGYNKWTSITGARINGDECTVHNRGSGWSLAAGICCYINGGITPSPTTASPTTAPTTASPTTVSPTTSAPTTASPTTTSPTTGSPTTTDPTTSAPTIPGTACYLCLYL